MSVQGTNKLRGIIPAIVTPYREDGAIDFDALERQAAYLCDAGVHGLFVSGGTGEGAYLTTAEKVEVLRRVRDVSGGRQFLCAAAIKPSTKAVLEEMNVLEAGEPDYLVAVTPFYHTMTQRDVFEHYRIIAEAASAPVIIYNIPPRTHNPVKLDTIYELAHVDNIAGIKDSSGDFLTFGRGVGSGLTPPGFSWIQGEDYLCAATLLATGDGIVSGLSNARIRPYLDMFDAYEREDWGRVRLCQRRIDRLYEIIHCCSDGNAAIKAATELAGRGTRWMRQHSQTVSAEQLASVTAILDHFDEAEDAQ